MVLPAGLRFERGALISPMLVPTLAEGTPLGPRGNRMLFCALRE